MKEGDGQAAGDKRGLRILCIGKPCTLLHAQYISFCGQEWLAPSLALHTTNEETAPTIALRTRGEPNRTDTPRMMAPARSVLNSLNKMA